MIKEFVKYFKIKLDEDMKNHKIPRYFVVPSKDYGIIDKEHSVLDNDNQKIVFSDNDIKECFKKLRELTKDLK